MWLIILSPTSRVGQYGLFATNTITTKLFFYNTITIQYRKWILRNNTIIAYHIVIQYNSQYNTIQGYGSLEEVVSGILCKSYKSDWSSVLLFTNISLVLKLSFSLYYNWWPPINFLQISMAWATQMVKY